MAWSTYITIRARITNSGLGGAPLMLELITNFKADWEDFFFLITKADWEDECGLRCF